MSSYSDMYKDQLAAAEFRQQAEQTELFNSILSAIKDRRRDSVGSLELLFEKDAGYPYFNGSKELVNRLTPDHITGLVQAASEDSVERADAFSRFATIYAADSLQTTTSYIAQDKMRAAFELQGQAIKELATTLRSK